ncbi:MAG: hypothetical protein EOP02_09875 [Proteobacteria bacterium]|nr:MAG: hypothetical protein EOP02_09875 [Pseudomonadota bacterium]
MTAYSHPILVRGRYQIVALTNEAEFDPGEVVGYAVLSPVGAKLHYEPGLEQARLWTDRLIEEEDQQRLDEPPSPARSIRRRR